MDQLLLTYCQLLLNNIQNDSNILNQWWMWAFACVPAVGYGTVMILKYTFLLIPVWLVLGLAMKGIGLIATVVGTVAGRVKTAFKAVSK